MSAGMLPLASEPKPSRDLSLLAPRFADVVEKSIKECNERGLDAFVYEAYRSNELQLIYYARGRTVKPPYKTVTNAKTNLYSWHGFGLAVDVISKSRMWDAGTGWFVKVAAVFKENGCSWGGDWQQADLPHMQWGKLRSTPSDRARQLLRDGGIEAVWREVDALHSTEPAEPLVRVLSLGMAGDDVRKLQLALGAPVTGVFDKITDAWVRGFQLGRGLAVDGDVGSATRTALGY